MARIAGIEIPNNKSCEVGLSYIYGIGRSAAKDILGKSNIDLLRKVGDLTEEELARIRKIIENEFTVEGALRTRVRMNIKRLMDIGCFRGLRHRRNMPVRGQRTRTNARTRKGPRKTIAGKKKAPGKG